MKVVVTELIWPEGLDALGEVSEVEYDPDLWKDRRRLLDSVADAEAVIVRNQTAVDEELLARGDSLKAVGRLGVGLDNIDLGAARARNVPVVSARNANAVSVAEYVVAAMMTVSRRIYAASEDVGRGGWDRKAFTGTEVYGKTLGLVGLGEISGRVASRARALGMKLVGTDPFVAPYDSPVVELGVELTDMDDLLARSDFISLHVPLTDGTRGLMDLESFRKMKPDAWVINSSRGGVVDESDLAAAVDEDLIGGAVLDVLEEEPPAKSNPLLGRERVVITPHIAGLTEESQVNTSGLVAEEVLKVLRGEPSLCVVG